MVSSTDVGSTPSALRVRTGIPEGIAYRLKCRFLGPPLATARLAHERLSKKTALGVLSSDCISSSAYGSEEILLVLLPLFGIAAYTLLLPMTGVVIGVLILVSLSYSQVVMIYTRAGGSYVVARENFGTTVAQIAAVALMLDYVVTVAVQAAAGTAALTSAAPGLTPWQTEITVGVVLLLCFGNLRGLREAGRAFAFPTYFFAASMLVVIVTGITREIHGQLPHYSLNVEGAYPVGNGQAVLSFLAVFVLLKSFANGGSSLTGLEAISNGVSAFRKPEGRNARTTLIIMSAILGTLVCGVSWLAHATHAVPYERGTPTVISQVAHAALGDGTIGHVLFLVVQLATMLILWTGANTPFNGFPFLVNFVAEDAFLPRWLTKRGHRLAFSNGIIVLVVLSLSLVLTTGAHVDKLVAFYAIGVFTGFSMAGFGMAKHHWVRRRLRERSRHWRLALAVNFASGALSALVVLVFAVTKFTDGAWLVVIIFPVLTIILIRLNRAYVRESQVLASMPENVLSSNYVRHVLLVFIDNVDLATLSTIRYGRSLKPSEMAVVHFVMDHAHADSLQKQWRTYSRLDMPLILVDCPDRRLVRTAMDYVQRSVSGRGTHVTVLLPRRTYSPLLGRLLHDRTADDIARAISRVPGAAATIVPFDVGGSINGESAAKDDTPPAFGEAAVGEDSLATPMLVGAASAPGRGGTPSSASTPRPTPIPHTVSMPHATTTPHTAQGTDHPRGTTPMGALTYRTRSVVQGRVRSVLLAPLADSCALTAELCDDTGGVTLLFYGRSSVAGLVPGASVRVTGLVSAFNGHFAITNPRYELLPDNSPNSQGPGVVRI
jgi:amino acid transporter